ncbi:hypothetical protein AB3M93_19580, partial [Novosphingobium panipatense]
IVNNNQPVPDVFSKMTKIAASGRLGLDALRDLVLSGELHDAKTVILAQHLLLRHPELWADTN